MLTSVFDAYNAAHPDKPLANPRNACAGTLLQKDPEAAAAAGRLLHFFAFDVEGPGRHARRPGRTAASPSRPSRS